MAAGKRGAPAPRAHSPGGYIREDERHTERLTLRLPKETMARLRARADERGWKMAELVGEGFEALERELKQLGEEQP